MILARVPEIFRELSARLDARGVRTVIASYEDLAFEIEDDAASIRIFENGKDICEFNKILVLSTTPKHSANYIFSSLACYCRKNGVVLLDDNYTNTDGKLYAMWRFWEEGIQIPRTAFGPVEFLAQKLADYDGVAVLKSVNATKGQDNYLVRSAAEIEKIVTENPDVHFIMQNFIENDGDYRVILTNFEPQMAIYRSANGKDFRNNTSLGGEARIVPLDELSDEIVNLAINAARALDVKIAGADILQDKRTGRNYVLEVNRTPQLATGAFTEEKIAIIENLIRSK